MKYYYNVITQLIRTTMQHPRKEALRYTDPYTTSHILWYSDWLHNDTTSAGSSNMSLHKPMGLWAYWWKLLWAYELFWAYQATR